MCLCSSMDNWVTGDDLSSPFKEMKQVAIKPEKFCTLRRCTDCSQHWQADAYDKYHKGICIKVDNPEQWMSFDDVPYREKRLVINYHGLSETTCIWSGCSNKALKDIVYCPTCALTRMNISS